MNSLVSLLIPCYNGECFLDRCFDGVLSQTYNEVEIIFVNDGSNDDTESKVKQYIDEFSKRGYIFKYLYQENQGAAAAINTALKHVTGKYIMLFDVDDILFPTAIEEKSLFLESNKDYDMVRNNGYYVNNNNIDKTLGLFITSSKEKSNEHIFKDLILGKTNNWPSTFMVRTEALFGQIKNKEIYISQYGQNLQIMLPVAYFGKSGFIDKPLMKYVKHSKSHSYSNNIARRLELSNGYEGNRISIINMLNIDEKEKKSYIKAINELYYRLRMGIACEYGNRKLLKQEYSKLKDNNVNTYKDMLRYYEGICGGYKVRHYINSILNKAKMSIVATD